MGQSQSRPSPRVTERERDIIYFDDDYTYVYRPGGQPQHIPSSATTRPIPRHVPVPVYSENLRSQIPNIETGNNFLGTVYSEQNIPTNAPVVPSRNPITTTTQAIPNPTSAQDNYHQPVVSVCPTNNSIVSPPNAPHYNVRAGVEEPSGGYPTITERPPPIPLNTGENALYPIISADNQRNISSPSTANNNVPRSTPVLSSIELPPMTERPPPIPITVRDHSLYNGAYASTADFIGHYPNPGSANLPNPASTKDVCTCPPPITATLPPQTPVTNSVKINANALVSSPNSLSVNPLVRPIPNNGPRGAPDKIPKNAVPKNQPTTEKPSPNAPTTKGKENLGPKGNAAKGPPNKSGWNRNRGQKNKQNPKQITNISKPTPAAPKTKAHPNTNPTPNPPKPREFLFPFELTMKTEDNKLWRGIYPKKDMLKPLKRLEFEEGSIQTYDQLFGPYLDKNVRAIKIHEPHLNKEFQLYNLVRFLEVCVLKAPNLRLVKIMTTTPEDAKIKDTLKDNLKEISDCLLERNIVLVVEIVSYYHDRSIVFDNGHAFDLGIGLHYFQKLNNNSRFALGLKEQRLRRTLHFICNISRFEGEKPVKVESKVESKVETKVESEVQS